MQDVVDLARWSATAQMLGAHFEPLIGKLEAEIETRVAQIVRPSVARDVVSFQAHAISSVAANFGCVRLHAASRELQLSARGDADIDLDPPISVVRAAAELTIAFLRTARVGLASRSA